MSSTTIPPAKSVSDSWIFTHRGLIGVACLGPAAVAAIFSKPLLKEGAPLELLLDISGWVFFLAYVGMRVWATIYLGGRKDRSLQASGPYSITRNPLYFGSFCFAMSLACFLKSFSLIVLTIAAAAAYASWVIPAEEDVLENIFGEQYREYKRRTPRLIPRPSLYTSAQTVEVRLAALGTEARRLMTASLMPVLAFVLLHFRGMPWWPHWFMMP